MEISWVANCRGGYVVGNLFGLKCVNLMKRESWKENKFNFLSLVKVDSILE